MKWASLDLSLPLYRSQIFLELVKLLAFQNYYLKTEISTVVHMFISLPLQVANVYPSSGYVTEKWTVRTDLMNSIARVIFSHTNIERSQLNHLFFFFLHGLTFPTKYILEGNNLGKCISYKGAVIVTIRSFCVLVTSIKHSWA